MSAFYDRMRATADRMIAKYGRAVTITRTSPVGAVSTFTSKAVTLRTVKHALADSNISIGDNMLLLDATVTPQPGDRITDGVDSRVLVDPVIPIRPAETVLAFECYARLG